MKIIKKDVVFVQKKDIKYITLSNLPIPNTIFTKLYGNGIFIVDESNMYDFIEFFEFDEIDFFKKSDWIIDYNIINTCSVYNIKELINKLVCDKNQILYKYNKLSTSEQNKQLNLIDCCELLDYKISSLREFILLKWGKINIELPEGIEYPKLEIKQDNNIKKLIKTIFKNNNM